MLALLLLALCYASTAATTAAAAPGTAKPVNTCDTDTSRLVLKNLQNLPQACKPGHDQAAAAAVFECFASSRVVVRKCRVTLLPGRAASRSGLACSAFRAVGKLTGEDVCGCAACLRRGWPLLNSCTPGSCSQCHVYAFLQQHPCSMCCSVSCRPQQCLPDSCAGQCQSGSHAGNTTTVQGPAAPVW